MRFYALTALILLAAPAAAQTKDDNTAAAADKVICRNEEVIGSRLQSTRVCLTKAQWAQRRREDRETVTRVQNQKSLNGGG
jgi:hypothetical protein